jgi:hypothetical protein
MSSSTGSDHRGGRGLRGRPHAILAGAVATNLALEIGRHERPAASGAVVALECCVVFLALAAIAQPERIRLWPLVLLAVAFQAGWVAIRLGLPHAPIRTDSSVVYHAEGSQLLHGHYPRSEYPPAAVLVFAFEALVGAGNTLVANAALMIPFQALAVASVWGLRTRSSTLLAAFVALWPANAFFLAYRFDAVPAALLAAGLLLGWRRRWGPAGVVLGLGAAVKWTPALAVLVICAWLASHREVGAALRHVGAAVLAFALVNLPFVLWAPSAVLAAYRRQGGRGITAESVYYLPLKALGVGHTPARIWYRAGAPPWADRLAIVAQLALLALIVALATRSRTELAGGLALAACAPAAFLLTNRIFSPQFAVVILTSLAIAVTLVGPHERRPRLGAIALLGGSALANALVFPFSLQLHGAARPLMMLASWVLVLGALAWSIRRAARGARVTPAPEAGPPRQVGAPRREEPVLPA